MSVPCGWQTMDILDFLRTVYAPHRLGLSAATQQQYSIACRSLERFSGHSVAVGDLSDELILSWLSARLKQVSPRTVKRERGDLLTLWRFATKKKYCQPPLDIPPVKVPRKLPVSWRLTDVEAILSTCRRLPGRMRGTEIRRSAWWSSLIFFLYDSGARIQAALTLPSRALCIAERYAVLPAESSKTGCEQICNLSDQTIAAIAAHYSPARELIWPYEYGRRQIWVQFKAILKRAELPVDRYHMFHCFRRTSGSLLQANGGDACSHLGHSSPAITRRHYLDPRIVGGGQVDRLPRPAVAVSDSQLRLF